MLIIAIITLLFAGSIVSAANLDQAYNCSIALGSSLLLPQAPSKGLCGRSLARCPPSECCNQYGRCSIAPCKLTCQCEVSGKKSSCTGKPWAHVSPSDLLPIAANAAPCGPTSARCGPGLCCSSYFSFCTNSASICDAGLCSRIASDPQYPCTDNRVSYIPIPLDSRIKRYVFNVTWGVRRIAGYTRYVILINNQFPGPLIEATEGDEIVVTVNNQMWNQPSPLMSIHWHGMLQRSNNIMDGVTGVTQQPLGPGQTQVYTFTADLQGSFWYHSHFKEQYMDGLRGPIRINPYVPRNISQSPLTVGEQYPLLSPNIMPLQLSEFYKNASFAKPGPVPQTSIIGGIGQGNCTGKGCDYYVAHGKQGGNCTSPTTRLSFVNTAGFAFFDVSIDEHYLLVVSLDSVGVIPSQYSTFIGLAPGQRVGVVVCPATPEAVARADKGGLFFINVTQNSAQLLSDAGSVSPTPTVLGILSYDRFVTGPKIKNLPSSNPWPLPNSKNQTVLDLTLGVSQTQYGLKPISMSPTLNGTGVPPPADFTQVFGLWAFPGGPLFFHFNSSFTYNSNSSLYNKSNPGWISLQLPKSRDETWLYDLRNNSLPPNFNGGPNILRFKEGDIVEFVFNNLDTFPHPLHIHGHWAWVMYQGVVNDGPYLGQPLITTPVLRDTAVVAANSSLVMRWVADNPGMWILHCHIDGHLVNGLAFVLTYGKA